MSFQIVIDALTQIVRDIVNFIPKLVNGLIILVIGYLIALVISWIVGFILRRTKFDPLVERIGLTGSMRGLGVNIPLSTILTKVVFVLLLLSFLITASRLMGLAPVAQVFEKVLTFLPALIAALIVFFLGGMAAQFVGNMITNLAASSGISNPGRLGKIVQHLISLIVVIIALGVLGIDTALLVTAVTIMIAAFGLALGLALGLGGKRIVQHVLAGYYMRQRFTVGQSLKFEETTGTVGGIGGVNTVIDTPEGRVVLPNGLLMESVIHSGNPPAKAEPDETSET
jgi:small-conductance mechanosensitive channel